MTPDASRAVAAIEQHGVLLLQDPHLPSLAVMIAGEPIRGSWWGHPAGNRIFNVQGEVEDHADVATFKLVDRKVCFVQRRLWPAIVSVGQAREAWQLTGLGAEARDLVDRVDAHGRVRATKQPAKQIETRLLAASEEVHTESGAHATELVRWDLFAAHHDVAALPDVEQAKRELEDAVAKLAAPTGATPRLPWQFTRRRSHSGRI